MQLRSAWIGVGLALAVTGAVIGCKKKTTAIVSQKPAATSQAAFVDANNLGVGLMGRFDFEGARQVFQHVIDGGHNVPAVQINLAIAVLNRQREGDSAAALLLLDRALAASPEDPRAIYCKALLLLNQGNPAGALELFSRVAKQDPSDAYAAYYKGQCLGALNRYADALAEYEQAIHLDPLLRSGYYGAFQCLSRLSKTAEAKSRLADFQKLADNPRAKLAEFKYTRMGPKAMAAVVNASPLSAAPSLPAGPAFADPVPLHIRNASGIAWRKRSDPGPRPTITAVDIDGDSRLDLFITSALKIDGALRNAVLLARDDGFELDLNHPLAAVADVNAAVWGDFDNDGLTDVYLCRRGPNQLWRQTARGQWRDITESAHASGGNYNTIDAVAVDADHDGDLDLFLVRQEGPNELLNNNLDGTFSAIGKQAGIAGDGRGAVGVLAADLNHDGLVDFLVLKAQPPHELFLNDRLWHFRTDENFKELLASPISAALAADPGATGQMEIYAISNGKLTRWSPDSQGVWFPLPRYPGGGQGGGLGRTHSNPHPAPPPGIPGEGEVASTPQNATTFSSAQPAAGKLALADIRGTGCWDLLFGTRGGWNAIGLGSDTSASGAGHAGGVEQGRAILNLSSPTSTPTNGLWTWSVANLDPRKGPAIIGFSDSGEGPVIWNPGPGRFPYAAISLSGRLNKADSMRSNTSGIGVQVAARADSRWTVASTYRNQTGPGQSLQPLAIGVGANRKLDFVNLIWSDGLRQTELDVPGGKLTPIAEVQRQTSSCPVIFVWDGRRYQFVTDCLGGGGIGFAVGPNEYAPERPSENVLLPEGLPAPRGGKLIVKIGEPMEEACYLDSAALAFYDLPPGWSMTLDERMAVNDPQPTGRALFYRKLLLPRRALNDRRQDVTDAITSVDGRAAEPGARDPRFIGFTKEHSIEMDFGVRLDSRPAGVDPSASLLLIADGWIEYPYSQTMFAAWQAKAPYRAPTLEARGADGKWVTVLKEFGYPAGMPRQMSIAVPIDRLPRGADRLRLRTDQEIYWDRLALAWAEPCPGATRHVLKFNSAMLADVGFPLRTTGPQRRPHYDYDHRLPLWDTRAQAGWYTAFGHVEELLAATDDACAIFGPGEEVQLAFPAPAAPVPSGWRRQFVLELTGWCKDRDLYTKDGDTLAPLPARPAATPESLRHRDALQAQYNTRYRSGP